jgi:hypothetical protein
MDQDIFRALAGLRTPQAAPALYMRPIVAEQHPDFRDMPAPSWRGIRFSRRR